MPRRIVRTERVDQPAGFGGGINRAHPFASNCTLAWQASAPTWNAATGQVGARTGQPTVEAGTEGVAQKFAGSQRFDFAGSPTYAAPSNGALLLCATFTATSGVNSFITGTSTANNSAHLICNTSSSFNLFIAGVLDISFGMTLVAGRLYTGAVFHEAVNNGNTRAFLRDHVTGEIKSGVGTGSVGTYNGSGNGRSYVGGFPTQPNYNGRVFQAQHFAGSLPRGTTAMDSLLRLLVREPWQIFETQTRAHYIPAAVTVYRPASDVIVNGWTPSTGSDLYAMIDEAVLNRADYITSPNLTDPTTMGWSASLAAGTYDVSVDFDRMGIQGQLRIVLLDSGGTAVGTSSWQAAPSSAATTVFSVTTTGTSDRFRIEVQA